MSAITIEPWLSVADGDAALAFYQDAFAAQVRERLDDDTGQLQLAQLAIGNACFWIQADAETNPHTVHHALPVRLILTVADPDTLVAAAALQGARVVVPINESHGWRVGRVIDPSGHHWEIGRRLASE
jgi:PhnB protein